MTAIDIRRAGPGDLARIGRFIAETYGAGAPFKDAARLRWQFIDNPFSADATGAPAIWLACDGDRVAGTIAVQDGRMRFAGQSLPAGWIVDVMVGPGYRGRGLAHRIHAAVAEDRAILVTLTMAEATRRVAEKAGAITLGPVRQFIRPHRLSAATVRRYLAYKAAGRGRGRALPIGLFNRSVAGPALAAAAARVLAPRPAPAAAGEFDIEEVAGFPAETDTLWEEAAPGFPALFERSARFLNWRFAEVPGLAYRRFLLRSAGRLRGYLVTRVGVREELPLGVVADFFAPPADRAALDALAALARAALEPHAEYLEAAASHPGFQAALRRAGFVAARTMRPTVVCRDPALRAELDRQPGVWHFTKADHDWDQVHPI